MHPMLNIAIKAARRVGRLINQASLHPSEIEVKKKAENSIVTNIDQASEKVIIGILQKAYPTHGILAEESGCFSSKDDYLWIIDPLDGTTNFVHGLPHYSISIALQYKEKITQACIYDPNRNELFTATKGYGAYLNERRIRVSNCQDLSDALVSVSLSQNSEKANAASCGQLGPVVSPKLRRTGSVALDLAYVAAGRLDGFLGNRLYTWDIAAGSLLIREAGGFITDLNGSENYLHNGEVMAATARIFRSLTSNFSN